MGRLDAWALSGGGLGGWEYDHIWSPRENWQRTHEMVWKGNPWQMVFDELDEGLVAMAAANKPVAEFVKGGSLQFDRVHVNDPILLQAIAVVESLIDGYVWSDIDRMLQDHQADLLKVMRERLSGFRVAQNRDLNRALNLPG